MTDPVTTSVPGQAARRLDANVFGVTAADVAHLDAGTQAVVEFSFGVRRGVLLNVQEGRYGWGLALNDRDPHVVLSTGQPGVYVVRIISPESRRPDPSIAGPSTEAPAPRISSADDSTPPRAIHEETP